jgi:hypothetical protein
LTAALQAPTPHTPAGMPTSFVVFAVCWIAIWIASWIFYSKASYQTKKSAHPFLIVAFGAMFLAFTEWVMQGKLPLLFVAALIVIMYLNFRNTQFCERYGATVYSHGFTRSKFCPKCGAPLQEGLPGNREA